MSTPADYRKILTELYEKYNPEKVKDVDFLLKKFAGREQEMIDKIRLKYGEEIREPLPETRPAALPIRKFIIGLLVVLGLGGATFGGVLLVDTLGEGEIFPGASASVRDSLFVIADTVFTRSNCGETGQKMRPLPYGTRVVVYGREVGEDGHSCIETELDGKTEYLPGQYLGDRKEYLEIDGIYGNAQARQLYDNSYEKRALWSYFRERNLLGNVPLAWQEELYDSVSNREVWQVFGKSHNGLDAAAKGKFTARWDEEEEGTRLPLDFAVIISRVDSSLESNERPVEEDGDWLDRPETRRLLLFGFDENKEGSLVDELNLSNYEGHFIRPIKFSAESYWWGSYLRLDAAPEDAEVLQSAILLEDIESVGEKYLIEIIEDQLQITRLRQTIFGYARDNTVIP